MTPDEIFLTVNGRKMSLAKLIENPAAATVVRVINCPALTELPALAAATDVWVENCPALTELPALAAATDVWVENCPALTELPALAAATVVRVINCPALIHAINVGADSRGYKFAGIKLRGQWRIMAGCRNFSLGEARKHWARNAECLALVEKIAVGIAAIERLAGAGIEIPAARTEPSL